MDYTKDELIANIREASAERERQASIKRDNEHQELKELVARIEKRASESFPTLFSVAEELVKNGYYIGDKKSWDKSPIFCTDGICHRLGFYLASGNPFLSAKGSMPVAFGNKGGGCCGVDFKISKEGKVICCDYSHYWCKRAMNDFIKDLDSFEVRFYDWVTQLKK